MSKGESERNAPRSTPSPGELGEEVRS